jgi:hypothetical protein
MGDLKTIVFTPGILNLLTKAVKYSISFTDLAISAPDPTEEQTRILKRRRDELLNLLGILEEALVHKVLFTPDSSLTLWSAIQVVTDKSRPNFLKVDFTPQEYKMLVSVQNRILETINQKLRLNMGMQRLK